MRSRELMRGVGLLVSIFLTLAGCHSRAGRSTQTTIADTDGVVDLDVAIASAGKIQRPIAILIGEFGTHGADRATRVLLHDPAIEVRNKEVEPLTLDLSVSRNRAVAARYHVTQTPMLVCLSAGGLIVSRDVGTFTTDIVVKRMEEVVARGAEMDAKLAILQGAVTKDRSDTKARLGLAEFLLAQQNDREAIPYLAELAHSDSVDMNTRIRAWVALARAHLWVTEPEKGRHEARDLISALGPTAPDAIAGGNLVLGLQDAAAKRFALARQEFQTAISASPDSTYAKQAGVSLGQLPAESK